MVFVSDAYKYAAGSLLFHYSSIPSPPYHHFLPLLAFPCMEAIELGLQIFSGVFMTLATAICLHDALLRNSWEKARLAAIEAEEAAEATRAAEDAASLKSESDCECDCETDNERETMDSNTKTVEDGWDDLSLDGSEWMDDFGMYDLSIMPLDVTAISVPLPC